MYFLLISLNRSLWVWLSHMHQFSVFAKWHFGIFNLLLDNSSILRTKEAVSRPDCIITLCA